MEVTAVPAQVIRDQLLALVHDKDALDIELDPAAAHVAVVEVKGRLGGNEQQGLFLNIMKSADMHKYQQNNLSNKKAA